MSLKSEKQTEQSDLFGFEAEYDENEGEFKTISDNEPRDVSMATKYDIRDFDIGNVVTGYPEVTIFNNNEKDENGEFKKKSQSVRVRIVDGDEEYVDLYANIPRRDDKGFVTGLNKYFNFYRTGFDLVYSFMRFLDETNVVDANGEEINRINKVNIENICKAIDKMEYIKVKIVESGDEDYPSWIILDLKEELI